MSGGGGGGQSTTEKRLNAIQINSAAYGSPVPLVYGQTRIPAVLVWYGDFKATPHTQSQGGKGGGGGSSTSYTYSAAIIMALCEGPIASVVSVFIDKGTDASIANQNLTLFTGAIAQSTWSYMTTNHSAQAIGYSGTAYVCSGGWQMGNSAALQNMTFEVSALYNGTAGATPTNILVDYLTHATHGASFPYLDTYWQGASADSFATYCTALGIKLSPAELTQRAAADFVTEILRITNSAAVWSAGLLHIIPYGDTSITANSVTYTPTNGNGASINTPIYTFTDDDYLADDDEPVKVSRKPASDTFNKVRIEYLDSANQYNVAIAEASDAQNIALYGERVAPTESFHSITSTTVARLVAQLLLQRGLYYRNQYTFKVRADYSLLEPGDVVALYESALGLSNALCRVTEVRDTADDELELVVEELPLGPGHAPQYSWDSAAGYAANTLASPGSVSAPVMFVMPPALVSGSGGYQVGVAVGGTSALWGGCDVYMSTDNVTYVQVGSMTSGGSRYGTLRSTFASNSADPDTTSSLQLQLVNTSQTMSAGSQADVDTLNTLVYVDGEIVAYRDCTLAGAGQYNLGYFHRGQYGSTIAAHSAGTNWARIDAGLFRVPLDPGLAGTTIYFKFVSFNIYGKAYESLASVTAYSKALPAATTSTAGTHQFVPRTYCVVNGSTISKAAGSTLAWDSDCYSTDSYSAGCTLSFRAGQTTADVAVGLSTNPTASQSISGIDFAIYMQPGGALNIYESNANVGAFGTYSTNDAFSIHYDGNAVTYFKNGTLLRSVVAPGKTLYMDSSIYTRGASVVGVTFTGTVSVSKAPINFLNSRAWVLGAMSSNLGNYAPNGPIGLNTIVLGGTGSEPLGPYGTSEPLWKGAGNATNNADGGWVNGDTGDIQGLDPTKTYRSLVWMRYSATGAVSGNLYHGCSQSATNDLSGAFNGNPYFNSLGLGALVPNRWYLSVGIIHGSGYSGSGTNVSGIYDPTTGAKVNVGVEFKQIPGKTYQTHRAFLYYTTTAGVVLYLARPAFEEVNGQEKTIQQLLSPANLDAIPDGTTYGRPLLGRLNAGRPLIDFSESIHSNKGAFATVNQVTTANSSTLVAAAAINNAHLIVARQGAPLNDDPGCQDQSAWSGWSSNPPATVTAITDGTMGNSCLRTGGGVNSRSINAKLIPADPNKKYRISAWVRSNGADGRLYLRTVVYPPTATSTSGGAEVALGIEAVTVPSTWTHYQAVFSVSSSYAFVSPQILLNWGGSVGSMDATDIRIEESVPLDSLVSDGPTYSRTLGTRVNAGRPLIDFSESIHTNKNLDNVADGTAGRVARTNYTITLSSGVPQWVNLGTLTFANWGTAFSFTIHGGSQYSSGQNTPATTTITVRCGDGTGAPNLSGVFFTETASGGASVYGVKLVAHGGSTSAGNTAWDLLVYLNVYNCPTLDVTAPVNGTFVYSGANTSDPGAASTTVVVANGGRVFIPSNGAGADALVDGTTYARTLASRVNAGRPVLDFSEAIHANQNVDNVADGSTYKRVLGTRINAGRPTIDFSEAIHTNQNVDNIADGSTYARVLGTALTSGSVDPTKAGVLAKGSLPPTIPAQSFTYASTTTTVAISWPAITVYRADGTTITISSGSQSISSLSVGTSYKVYPYMADSGGSSGTVSWPTGGTGSPAIAQPFAGSATAAATMYARGNIPLNSFIITTTTSGTGSGGGGGGGCPHPDTLVELADGVITPAGELRIGDMLPTPSGPQPITALSRWVMSRWVVVEVDRAGVVIVSPDHAFYSVRGDLVRADELRLGELLRTDGNHAEVTGLFLRNDPASVVSLELPEPHLYYLGPKRLLSHNPKP